MEHPESLDFTQLLNNSLATHPSRVRKQSAFTHVTGRSGLKRPLSDPDLLSEIKVRRGVRLGGGGGACAGKELHGSSHGTCQVHDVKRFSN